MQALRSLSAGLVDAGFASLATFGIGVYAARTLEVGALGVFALHFAAFTLVSAISHQGVFIPLEAAASRIQDPVRFARRSLSLGWIPVVLAPLTLLLPQLAIPGSVPMAMGVSAAAAVALSPMQDHTRRLLHLLGASWMAARMSMVQAAATAAALFLLHHRIPDTVVPFTALALANLLSLGTGLVFLAFRPRPAFGPTQGETPALKTLFRSGRWLLGAQLSAAAGTFLAAAALGRFGSMEALGLADAARIVGRPVLVVTTGMTAVFGPRLMRAGGTRDPLAGRSVARTYRQTVTVCVLGYVALFGWRHGWNPLAWLVPAAYEVPLLVLATCVVNGLVGGVLPARFEAIGAGRARALLRVDVLAGLVQVASAGLAGVTQAFTIPLGKAAFAVVRHRGLVTVRRDIYADPPRVPSGSVLAPPPPRHPAHAR
ncbi:MAG: hypothetical protein OEO23_04000 [Gemmatimonadota bacterium]|nr:hypothetical protein [Gemmatimonadota bacterium]